jgi:RNA polymerase sigma-70 factor (ECF subfamily)
MVDMGREPSRMQPSEGEGESARVEPITRLDFRDIYERWFDDVSRWVRMMGGPEAEREDLVQDVFLVVYRRLPDFDGNNVPGWLYQIARRRVRDFRRLLWVRKMFGAVPLSVNLAEDGASPADSLQTAEKRVILEKALDTLNESERVALALFEIYGQSGTEIAEVQGVPLNTVWARIYKARRKLKAALAKVDRDERAHTHLPKGRSR